MTDTTEEADDWPKDSLLELLDTLRRKVETGEIVGIMAFAGCCEPFRVFAPVTVAIDECACKNIVLGHSPGSVQNFARRAACLRPGLCQWTCWISGRHRPAIT